MSANPGTLAGQIPSTDSSSARKQRDQERDGTQQYAVLARTVATLQGQVATLQGAVDDLTDVNAKLLAYATVAYAEFTSTLTLPLAEYDPNTKVTVNSPTGRLEISFGGTLNNGSGFFVYEVSGPVSGVVISRASVLANPARRAAQTGGASFAPSAHNNAIVNVPANEDMTVALWLIPNTAGVVYFGGSIQARVAP